MAVISFVTRTHGAANKNIVIIVKFLSSLYHKSLAETSRIGDRVGEVSADVPSLTSDQSLITEPATEPVTEPVTITEPQHRLSTHAQSHTGIQLSETQVHFN